MNATYTVMVMGEQREEFDITSQVVDLFVESGYDEEIHAAWMFVENLKASYPGRDINLFINGERN